MISHPLNQDFVAVRGEAFARPAAVAAVRARSFCLAAEQKAGRDRARSARTSRWRGARRRERLIRCDGPVSVECGEQDRCEGTGLRAGAFPLGAAEARLFGTLRAAGAGRAGAGRRRARICSTATRSGSRWRILSCRRRTTCRSSAWRRGVPEARPGRPHHGQRFHPRAHRHLDGCGVRRARHISSRSGSRSGSKAYGAEARARLLRLRQAATKAAGGGSE